MSQKEYNTYSNEYRTYIRGYKVKHPRCSYPSIPSWNIIEKKIATQVQSIISSEHHEVNHVESVNELQQDRRDYSAVTQYCLGRIKNAANIQEYQEIMNIYTTYIREFKEHRKTIEVLSIQLPTWESLHHSSSTKPHQFNDELEMPLLMGSENENMEYMDGGDLQDTMGNFKIQVQYFFEKIRGCTTKAQYDHYVHDIEVLVEHYREHNVNVSFPQNCPKWYQIQASH